MPGCHSTAPISHCAPPCPSPLAGRGRPRWPATEQLPPASMTILPSKGKRLSVVPPFRDKLPLAKALASSIAARKEHCAPPCDTLASQTPSPLRHREGPIDIHAERPDRLAAGQHPDAQHKYRQATHQARAARPSGTIRRNHRHLPRSFASCGRTGHTGIAVWQIMRNDILIGRPTGFKSDRAQGTLMERVDYANNRRKAVLICSNPSRKSISNVSARARTICRFTRRSSR